MPSPLNDAALNQLFRDARTTKYWLDQPVSDDILHQLAELVLQGPTAANSLPARLLFVRSAEGKARLRPCLAPGNVEQTMAAPVTVIVAYDLDFPDTLPAQFPHVDARSWLDDLSHTYTTPEQHAIHQGRSTHATSTVSDITFF